MDLQPVFDSQGQLEIGQPAPGFELPGVDGNRYNLEDYRGKVKALAVIFSCNHCPYVIKWEDRMIDLAKEYKDRGFELIAVCSNDPARYPQDSFANMKVRAREKGFPFPYVHDETQEVARAYGAKVTPHVFLFDGDLKLRYRGAIDDNPDLENRPTANYLKDAVEALLAGEPDAVGTSKTREVGCSIKWK